MPEGFEGDALILDTSQPRASALEQSSRSISLCHWTRTDPGLLNSWRYVCIHPTKIFFLTFEQKLNAVNQT